MSQTINSKPYDLEDRTYNFAKSCRDFARKLPKQLIYIDDIKQLIRSSGSVAANFIEANESLSKKDFAHRIKICRKESKESRLWLNLLEIDDKNILSIKNKLIQESIELCKIFGAILEKCK